MPAAQRPIEPRRRNAVLFPAVVLKHPN